MIDKSLFSRLRTVFSTGTVVRNIGGTSLKVIDADRIAAYGDLQTNSLVDRFTRLHKGGMNMQYNPTMNYQTLRLQLYNDYEAMDTDPILSSVLDIISEEATLKGEIGEILRIKSNNENIQKILYNLFYDVLNIEFNLPMWIRSMCLHENTMIPLLDGTEISIKDLSDRYNSGHNKPIWVYSVQEGTNRVVPGKVKWCGITRKNTKILRVTLDDNTYIDVTPDHKFIMRDGSKKEAKDLLANDSLMPFYTKQSSSSSDGIYGYEKIYNPSSNKYNVTHRLIVHECHIRNIIEEISTGKRYDTHHIDFNKKNNSPENLIRMPHEEHFKLHSGIAKENLWKDDKIIKKRKEGQLKWLKSDYRKDKMSKEMSGIYPECFKTYNNSELHQTHNVIRSKKMTDSWKSGRIKGKPSLILNDECLSFIKKYIKNIGIYTSLSTVVKALKSNKEFNILYSEANPDYFWGLEKSYNTRQFGRLIKTYTGVFYPEFVVEILPEVKKSDLYKRLSAAIHSKTLKNHKVKSIEYLIESSDTYCMEVVGPNDEEDRHNFAVCSYNVDGTYSRNGVFVSNCKFGDFYLHLDIAEKYGVYNVKPLSVYDIYREEGQDPNRPNYVRFVWNPVAVAGGTQASKDSRSFENYEIAHFRLLSDSNFLPYGRSYFEPARKIYKQYSLVLDAAILHRIMRSPEKRIFYMNIGNIPPNEINAYMQNVINTMKKTPYIDQQTGDYNLKFNMQNMLEDFYIPVRPGDTTTRIETAKGLEYTGMDDVTFMRDLMLTAVKVPKAFLNYSDELNGKSTISSLDLRFSKTIEKIQKVVVSELYKIALVHLYVQGYEDADLVNFELSLNNPSIIYEQEKIALLKEKVALAGDIMDKKLFSTDWIADKIFDMSEDQLNAERDLIVYDMERVFRYNQIENEGNDPAISGQSYGTPHDLASVYKANASGKEDMKVPDGYDENKNPVGRPQEKASIYKTDDSAFGRDPLGSKEMKGEPKNKRKDKIKPMALESQNNKIVKDLNHLKKSNNSKKILTENNIELPRLLDEKNIIEDLES